MEPESRDSAGIKQKKTSNINIVQTHLLEFFYYFF